MVFDVGAGQYIYLHPLENPKENMIVDCGGDGDYNPTEFLSRFLGESVAEKAVLGTLALTNYDQDHFHHIEDVRARFVINKVRFPKNITSDDLYDIKETPTSELDHVCEIKDLYTLPAEHQAPYDVYSSHLEKSDLDGDINTNHLSQIMFIDYGGSRICITGDLEKPAWEVLLRREKIQEMLSGTNVLIAPHHGRENGYHADIFKYCSPEVVIISDKPLIHETQDGMPQLYGNNVGGEGVLVAGRRRKVLTTRSDGHLLIQFEANGNRSYTTLNIER